MLLSDKKGFIQTFWRASETFSQLNYSELLRKIHRSAVTDNYFIDPDTFMMLLSNSKQNNS